MARAEPTVVYIPITHDSPRAGGRYDIGGPPARSRFYPGAVTLVRNEAGGRWRVERWTIAQLPGSLACFQVWLTEAGA